MKKRKLLALLTAALIFFACQKEDTVTENAAGEITSAAESVSDTVETSGTSAEISEVVSSEKVTEHTVSESGTELTEESAETEETADETLLQKALRSAGEKDNYGFVGRIFIDLNFDGFPEMIKCDKYDNYYFYTFNMEMGEWESREEIDNKLYLYNDEERGLHFYFFIGSYEADGSPMLERLNIYGDNIFEFELLGITDAYHCGDCGKVVAFQHTNGAFAVGEFDGYGEEITEFLYSTAIKGLEEYNLEKIIDLNEMMAGVDKSQKFEIFDEDFADEPQENGLPKYVYDENKNPWIPNCEVYLDASDMSEDTFAKLAENKKITRLIVSSFDENADSVTYDYTGISRLENLKELIVSGNRENCINADEIGKLKNLEILDISSQLDNYDFLSELDNLKIIQFGNTFDKPADFFKPIYGMKNLRYMLVSIWDDNITDEQVEELKQNMPQLCICYYKRG